MFAFHLYTFSLPNNIHLHCRLLVSRRLRASIVSVSVRKHSIKGLHLTQSHQQLTLAFWTPLSPPARARIDPHQRQGSLERAIQCSNAENTRCKTTKSPALSQYLANRTASFAHFCTAKIVTFEPNCGER